MNAKLGGAVMKQKTKLNINSFFLKENRGHVITRAVMYAVKDKKNAI